MEDRTYARLKRLYKAAKNVKKSNVIRKRY
ncbi:hypothetical protein COLO4_06438 [Corchorus olitorius]|uniref:Uncharacterized protein n=1 Tax=Corchorus olitorius TaxID=93759 RepID=A0A1R3KN30_9ROSI|nr:hypothetical protein COLO4_06438 [Corchorus olitorius]